MHANTLYRQDNSSNQYSKAAALCIQAKRYNEHWSGWVVSKNLYHAILLSAMPHAKAISLFSRFHLGCRLSFGTGGPFKVEGSSLWAAYFSLEPRPQAQIFHTKYSQQQMCDGPSLQIFCAKNLGLGTRLTGLWITNNVAVKMSKLYHITQEQFPSLKI